MKLQQRIELLEKLGFFLSENAAETDAAKQQAYIQNSWFIPAFIDLQLKNICSAFLQKEKLQQWVSHYHLDDNIGSRNVGIVMAGNIPLVGFHDFLCVFISGHQQTIKLSSKDNVLLKFIVEKMISWDARVKDQVAFAEMLKDRDAYIATGNNNSARYFEYYFSKYPSIIRHNRTSVALLDGNETAEQLDKLADDVHLYFGLGCRNVTKIYVPQEYDFVPLLKAFEKYGYFSDHNKYRNNFDYYLSLQMMNSRFYMTNNSIVLAENESPFSAISVLNYEFYKDADAVREKLKDDERIQCIVSKEDIAFGKTQCPALMDYADGIDTMQFLLSL
ncbi:MAG: acyl-CoA reductase [Ferruginibacter sp.]